MKFYSLSLLLLGASAIKLNGPNFYNASNKYVYPKSQKWEGNGEAEPRQEESISTALFGWYGTSLGKA